MTNSTTSQDNRFNDYLNYINKAYGVNYNYDDLTNPYTTGTRLLGDTGWTGLRDALYSEGSGMPSNFSGITIGTPGKAGYSTYIAPDGKGGFTSKEYAQNNSIWDGLAPIAVMAAMATGAGALAGGAGAGAGAAGGGLMGGEAALGAGLGDAAGGGMLLDTAGMGLTGAGGIGSASSLAGALGPAAYSNLGYTGLAGGALGSLGGATDPFANETAKFAAQNSAQNGSLLPTNLPTVNMPGNSLSDILSGRVKNQAVKSGLNSLTGSGGNTMSFLDGVNPNGLFGTLLQNYGTNQIQNNIQGTANTSANNLNGLAASLANKGKFTPYNVRSGFGSTTADANGLRTDLSPQYQAIQSAALGQAGGLLTPYSNSNVSNFGQQAYDLANSTLQQKANPLYGQNEQSGLSGANSLLQRAGGFDPEADASKEFGLTQQILAQGRQQDNLDLENRLLQQGRLGLSTGPGGAAPELTALKNAQTQQDLQNALAARTGAYNRQSQMLSDANTLQGLGINAGAAGQSMQNGIYNQAQGLFGMGTSADKFIEDMNNSRTARAGQLQNIGSFGDQMLSQQANQGLQAGTQSANTATANNRLLGDLGTSAEAIRFGGAQANTNLQNDRIKSILGSVNGGGGLLGNGAGGAGSAIVNGLKSLFSSGQLNPQQAEQVLQQYLSSGAISQQDLAEAFGGGAISDVADTSNLGSIFGF